MSNDANDQATKFVATAHATDPIRHAHTVIIQAIADLKAANIPVPMALVLAAYALRPETDKLVKGACNGQGAAGAI